MCLCIHRLLKYLLALKDFYNAKNNVASICCACKIFSGFFEFRSTSTSTTIDADRG